MAEIYGLYINGVMNHLATGMILQVPPLKTTMAIAGKSIDSLTSTQMACFSIVIFGGVFIAAYISYPYPIATQLGCDDLKRN